MTQFGFGFPSDQLDSTEGETRGGGRGEDFTQERGRNHFLSNPERKEVVVCFHISFALNVSLKIKRHRSSAQVCCAGPPMGTLVPF